jgi:hypothetical protein
VFPKYVLEVQDLLAGVQTLTVGHVTPGLQGAHSHLLSIVTAVAATAVVRTVGMTASVLSVEIVKRVVVKYGVRMLAHTHTVGTDLYRIGTSHKLLQTVCSHIANLTVGSSSMTASTTSA